jgi:hypothetical protein
MHVKVAGPWRGRPAPGNRRDNTRTPVDPAYAAAVGVGDVHVVARVECQLERRVETRGQSRPASAIRLEAAASRNRHGPVEESSGGRTTVAGSTLCTLDVQVLLYEAQRAYHDSTRFRIVHCALEPAAAIRMFQKHHIALRS